MTTQQLQKRVRELELEVARLNGALEEARRGGTAPTVPVPYYVPEYPRYTPWTPAPILPWPTTTCGDETVSWPGTTYNPLRDGIRTTF